MSYGINNATGQPSAEEVYAILDDARKLGIQTLDTAGAYGSAQELIGNYHRMNNQTFQVNSKFKGTDASSLRKELEQCLHTLHINAVKTYFFHSFSDYITTPSLLYHLTQLREQKLIGSIGISVYSNEELRQAIAEPEIDTIQLPFNLLDNVSKRGTLLKEAKEKGKKIQVRSIFLQGLFFKDPHTLPPVLFPLKSYLETLHYIAKVHTIGMETMCLQYVCAQQEIDELIIGVDTSQQLHRNLEAIQENCPASLLPLIDKVDVHENNLLYPYNWK
jgi:aryl-alcohol dehydrogenase-like predicted oxidoreductase